MMSKLINLFTKKKVQKTIQGFPLGEVIDSWVYKAFPDNILVVLTEVDLSQKPTLFKSLNILDKIEFSKQVVILQVTDTHELWKLSKVIPRSFAKARGYRFGKWMWTNEDLR